MPKIKKKGQSGQAKNYITRTQAVRRLQISLPDFRKLCIWKGIYPREPRSRRKVSKSSTNSTTFYYTKDIQYLLHEPLLRKFREQKVLEKKISKALGRGDVSDAARLDRNAARPEKTGRPRYTLDHIIRERYPTFIDALRDLDDCLSMLFLFANLPSTSTVPPKMIARCEKLCLEFQHYLIVSHSLRKSFLSIKGVYYQATIQGEDILWVVPYKFNQRVVGDVDFRIMGTFVEFYMTLLGFVNFRLYSSVGLRYPPKFDQKKDDLSGELGAFTLEGSLTNGQNEKQAALANGDAKEEREIDPQVQASVDKLVKELQTTESNGEENGADVGDAAEDEANGATTDALDKFEPAAPGGDILPQPDYTSDETAKLFSDFTFYLSRETPRQPLEFLLRAFGCQRIGWDEVLGEGAYTTDERDPAITHQIVDRPLIEAAANPEKGDGEDNQTSQKLGPNMRIPGRTYVQPQWVWDSINDAELKRPDLYAPGAQLPPHLSPFVKLAQGQYDPTMPLEEQETEAEALEADLEGLDDVEEAEEDELYDPDMDTADGNNAEEDEDDGSFGGFSDDDAAGSDGDDDEVAERLQRQQELEAEIKGTALKKERAEPDAQTKAKIQARKDLARKAKEEAEELERAKGMLSKKKRRLFESMQYSNSKKSAADEVLRAKRRRIENARVKA
jgi:pescadillo